jgi:hypothetical protein
MQKNTSIIQKHIKHNISMEWQHITHSRSTYHKSTWVPYNLKHHRKVFVCHLIHKYYNTSMHLNISSKVFVRNIKWQYYNTSIHLDVGRAVCSASNTSISQIHNTPIHLDCLSEVFVRHEMHQYYNMATTIHPDHPTHEIRCLLNN